MDKIDAIKYILAKKLNNNKKEQFLVTKIFLQDILIHSLIHTKEVYFHLYPFMIR